MKKQKPTTTFWKPVKSTKIKSNINYPKSFSSVKPVKLSIYPKRTAKEVRLIDKNPWSDTDRDKVPNFFDCKPLNKKKQGKFVQNIPIEKAKFISYYHGTTKEKAEKILEPLYPHAKVLAKKKLKKGFEYPVYITQDKPVALLYAEGGPEAWGEKSESERTPIIEEGKKLIKEYNLLEIPRHLPDRIKLLSGKIEKYQKLDKDKLVKELNEKERLDLKQNWGRLKKEKIKPAILKVTIPTKTIDKYYRRLDKYGGMLDVLNSDLELEFYPSDKKLYNIPSKFKIKEINPEKFKKKAISQSMEPEYVGKEFISDFDFQKRHEPLMNKVDWKGEKLKVGDIVKFEKDIILNRNKDIDINEIRRYRIAKIISKEKDIKERNPVMVAKIIKGGGDKPGQLVWENYIHLEKISPDIIEKTPLYETLQGKIIPKEIAQEIEKEIELEKEYKNLSEKSAQELIDDVSK